MEKDLSPEIWVQVWPEFECEWQRWPGAPRISQKADDFPEIKVGKRGVTPWASCNETLMNKFPQLKVNSGRGTSEAQKTVNVFD